MRIESERLELAAPFGRSIAEAFDADAAGQATVNGGSNEIRSEERERDCQVDLTDTAVFASRDLLYIRD